MRAWQAATLHYLARPSVALPLLAALLATQVLPLWTPTPDGAGYLSIAGSIAHGGPPTNMGSPKLHYPPGYPLLVSPLFLFSARPLLLLLVVQWLFAVAFMAGVYVWSRRWFPAGALWITALTMANVSLWIHARTTISEIPFMALLVWTALAADRLVDVKAARETVCWGALMALLVMALSMIRPVGVLLVVGYAAVVCRQARLGRISWRRAVATTGLVGTPAAVAILALLLYEAHMAEIVGAWENVTYLHEFKAADVSLAAQLLEGLRVRGSEVGRLLVPGMFKAYARSYQWLNINVAIFLSLSCGLAWAWWRVSRQARSALLLMSPSYLALYVAYPSDQGTRYLLPLLPVLVVCLWWLVGRLPKHGERWMAALVAAHLLVALGYSVQTTVKLLPINALWPAVDALAETIRDDPRGVMLWGVPTTTREVMMLAADRNVYEARPGGEIPTDVAWLLASADATDRPGFVERARSGSLKLLERADQVSRGPAAGGKR